MAAYIAALVSAPATALCALVQGLSCAVSTVNIVSCLCHGALGKQTGISPTAAKLFYTLLLGLSAMVAMILRHHSEKFNFGAFGDLNCPSDGSHCKGDQAIFRISFVLVLFFTLMMLLSLVGEGFHRGYWGIKIVLLLLGMVGSFYIPSDGFNTHAYAGFARFGSLGFLVLQILILIDFAYQVNDAWVAKAYAGDAGGYGDAVNRNWLWAILVSAGGLYLASIAGVVLLFVFYGKCDISIAFTSVTLIAVVCMTALSVFRDKMFGTETQGSILPTGLVSAYVIFLCWSALESNPDDKCRPSAHHTALDFTFGTIFASITLMWSAFSATANAGHLVKGETLEKAGANEHEATGVELGGPIISNDLEENMVGGDADEVADTPVYSDEQSWTFHLIMISASLYMAMLLTDWGSAKGPGNAGEASMWMKIVAQWLTAALFCWTLVAPAVLRDRDFS